MFVIQFVFLIQMLFYQKCIGEKRMESRVVGGEFTPIEKHPYCASLAIGPYKKRGKAWSCGSSIVNQRVLLTAAHCLEDCDRQNKCIIIVSVGNSNKETGKFYVTGKFKVHEKYDIDTVENDIALIFTNKNIELNNVVSKIILIKNPPYREHGVVAGWGDIDDKSLKQTKWLKHVDQNIIPTSKCQEILRDIPDGTVCGEKLSKTYGEGKEYVSRGDSGCALVVRGIIQIGLVSYRSPLKSKTLVVYTDVGYFYDWIKQTAEGQYCKYMVKWKRTGQKITK